MRRREGGALPLPPLREALAVVTLHADLRRAEGWAAENGNPDIALLLDLGNDLAFVGRFASCWFMLSLL